jgi:hypothetical protein
MDAREAAGRIGGVLLAPLTFALSWARRARMFHPDGTLFRAEVRPLAELGPPDGLARRLAGAGLVRLSSAWWRGGKEWRDVLGCALRFGPEQDLLFATIRSPWTMALAPLTTETHDYLANDYYAVSPFEAEGVGLVKLRLRRPPPVPLAHPGHLSREEQLRRQVAAGQAAFTLEWLRLPPTRGLRGAVAGARAGTALDPAARWEPVVEVKLLEPVAMDQRALRFSPFRDGRGLSPRGFVHALRRAAYAASRAGRGAPKALPAH